MRLMAIAAMVLAAAETAALAQKLVSPEIMPSAPAISQPPSPSAQQQRQSDESERANARQDSNTEPHGTPDRSIIVNTLPAEKTAAEREEDQKGRADKASADWWFRVLTGALVAVGIMQFLALVGQAIVFGIQARRLRDSYRPHSEHCGSSRTGYARLYSRDRAGSRHRPNCSDFQSARVCLRIHSAYFDR